MTVTEGSCLQTSLLCSRILICDSIAKMSGQQCEVVFSWIQEQLGCRNINQFLTKMICSDLSDHDLFPSSLLHNLQTKISTTMKVSTVSKRNKDNNDILFPLMSLPTDLIQRIVQFLDDTEIIHFERCSRQNFEITNNISFLLYRRNYCDSKCRELILNNKKLNKIVKYNANLFKYCKSNQLTLDFTCDLAMEKRYTQYDDKSHDLNDVNVDCLQLQLQSWYPHLIKNFQILLDETRFPWFKIMLKSIKVLNINKQSISIIHLLPIGCLFDSGINNTLENVNIQICELSDSQTWIPPLKSLNDVPRNIFESNYKRYFKYQDPDEKSKCLKCVKFDGTIQMTFFIKSININCLNTKHLWMSNQTLGLDYFSHNCPLQLRILTFDGYSGIVLNSDNENDNDNDNDCNYNDSCSDDDRNLNCNENSNVNININSNSNINIETIRIITNEKCYTDSGFYEPLFNNIKIISKMNLHNSLKNLILNFEVRFYQNQREYYKTILRNIILKKYFYNLENVCILLIGNDNACANGVYTSKQLCQWTVDWLFDKLLIPNRKLLKYQFKQLYFGLHCGDDACHVFQWRDETMTEKILRQMQQKWHKVWKYGETTAVTNTNKRDQEVQMSDQAEEEVSESSDDSDCDSDSDFENDMWWYEDEFNRLKMLYI